MIVAKFGGSSVADATAMLRCSDLIDQNPEIKIAVISATYQTTNHLENLRAKALKQDQSLFEDLESMYVRHEKIARDLRANPEVFQALENLFEEAERLLRGIMLLRECSAKSMDQLYSVGERLSSPLLAQAIKSKKALVLDARQVIRTNSQFGQAEPDIMEVYRLVQTLWKPYLEDPNTVIVTQGFIGSSPDGDTTTLGREGSDFTVSLLGEAIRAKSIQIWKDVQGIASADPRVVKEVQYRQEMAYNEMAELSFLGAKVLHPKTIKPAMRQSIPVYIGSSIEPERPGTWIKKEAQNKQAIRAVAMKQNLSFITLRNGQHMPSRDFLNSTLEVLAQIDFEFLQTHQSKIHFITDDSFDQKVQEKLRQFCDVDIQENLALLSLIGDQEKLQRLQAESDFREIPFIQLYEGFSDYALSFLVDQTLSLSLMKQLHQQFIQSPQELLTQEHA